MELTDRKKRVLRAIVETYINTAEPVGSKAIAQLAGLDVSAATIRNEMADLTEMGLLEQPHTSAGRVPSAAGYRLYVNELMGQHQLPLQETERINRALNLKMEELDRVIDQAGKVLSQISDYPVFTMAELDELPELVAFADHLEAATLATIEAGEMTGDLARITTLPNPVTLSTSEFIKAIARRLAA